MLGAIAGDVIGSIYEHRPIKTTRFPLFHQLCRYTDDTVRETVQALGLVDCTEREGAPATGVLPTTHSLGMLARALLRPLPEYVHAYFHDYDLVDPLRRGVLDASLRALGRRRPQLDPFAVSPASAP